MVGGVGDDGAETVAVANSDEFTAESEAEAETETATAGGDTSADSAIHITRIDGFGWQKSDAVSRRRGRRRVVRRKDASSGVFTRNRTSRRHSHWRNAWMAGAMLERVLGPNMNGSRRPLDWVCCCFMVWAVSCHVSKEEEPM